MPSMAMLQRSRVLARASSAASAASAASGASAATLPRLHSAPRQNAGRAAAALHTSASSSFRASLRRAAPPDVESPAAAPAEPAAFASPRPFAQSYKTRLPMPLPRDVNELELRRVRAAAKAGKRAVKATEMEPPSAEALRDMELDRRYFLPSISRENLSILRACLTTGLVDRATKLFMQLQSEEDARTNMTEHDRLASGHQLLLDEQLYNLMLGAFLRKAWATKSSRQNEWLDRAWTTFREMTESTAESRALRPQPGPSTLAIMLKGIVRLQSSGSYPADSPSLYTLVSTARRFDIPLERVFSSHIFSESAPDDASTLSRHRDQEPDAAHAIAMLIDATSEAGDVLAQTELQTAAQSIASRASAEDPEFGGPAPEIEPLEDLKPTRTATEEVVPNLDILRASLGAVAEGRQTEADAYMRQDVLERSALKAARLRIEAEAKQMEKLPFRNDSGLKGRRLRLWMWEWLQKLEKRIAQELERIRIDQTKAMRERVAARSSGFTDGVDAPDAEDRAATQMEDNLLPFLGLLSPNAMGLITIIEVMRLHGTSGVPDGTKATRALVHVGRAVEAEHHVNLLAQRPHLRKFARKLSANLRGNSLLDQNLRSRLRAEARAEGIHDLDGELQPWSQSTRARVGSFLVQLLMQEATVTRSARDADGKLHTEEHPAFIAAYQYIQGRKLGIIRVNEVVSERLDKEHIGSIDARMLPMLVAPRPWMAHNQGGYQTTRTSAMRYKDCVEQEQYLQAASDNAELDVVLSALDVLGQTPWRVNRRVYDVVSHIWNSGRSFHKIPASPFDEPEPQRPADYDSNMQAKTDYTRRLKIWSLNRANAHSQRCDLNYKLEVARAFMGERMYFPHNMDFRGRAYPIPPHLNHLGDDLARGLLLFDDAKPLGERGLYWLQIHLANLYGFDKANFSDRQAFTARHEKQIRASAANPLGESEDEQWWQQADDPWQCLATCIELQQAYDHPAGPEGYESRLPVHQDGTCNGLQHYAALGGDMDGAQQVNLMGGDRPSDVYTKVADLVIEIIERQATTEGHPQRELAEMVRGKITRKVVKQTVMTTVYGVTFIGAKNQIYRQLQDRGDIPVEHEYVCATYLAHCVLMCIGDLFSGAGAIQAWLTQSARIISRSIPPGRVLVTEHDDSTRKLGNGGLPPSGISVPAARKASDDKVPLVRGGVRLAKEQMTSVIWTTPLGLPVVQPYRKDVKRQIFTAMQSVYISDPNRMAEVDSQKQASAFPPNFIHSLDATHMFLTAIECHAKQLTFASVHDSYWTHACDIDTMSDIIRDTFVRLHSENILGRLRAEFIDRYKDFKVPAADARAVARYVAKREIRVKKLRLMAAKPLEEMVRTDLSEVADVLATDDAAALDPDAEQKPSSKPGRPARKSTRGANSDDAEAAEGTLAPLPSLPSSEWKLQLDLRTDLRTDMSVDDAASRAVLAYEALPRSGFVNLADLLPEPPVRGAFDVSEIKHSLYFFS